ncbi:MAG: tyrosine-type recombinase/integrase [Pseudomonadota bacterium]
MSNFIYNSPLQTFIEDMIREKQSLGYKYDSSPRTLYKFDQFCIKYGCIDAVITKELVHAWIQKTPNESVATVKNRACVIRQLALYMTRLGIQAYVLPKNSLPKVPKYTPYIFSNHEMAALLAQTDACRYCSEVPLRHHIMPLLFRLLYGSGLRISEALNLRVEDIDLHDGVLTVIDGKFNKDRLVPLGEENSRRCCEYIKTVHLFSDKSAYLFPSPNGQMITHGNAYKNFRRFLWQARISHGGWGKGPRLHDIRHTFAVHCLRQWVIQGKDLAAYLPILKTYLGHDSFRDTSYYLRLTAEVYPDITAKVEQAFGYIIPVIGDDAHEAD